MSLNAISLTTENAVTERFTRLNGVLPIDRRRCASIRTSLVLGAVPITDRGLAVVRGMRHLETLNVTGTRVTNDGLNLLVDLPELNLLRIGGPAITDAGMARLKSMKQLKQLILWDCPLTD